MGVEKLIRIDKCICVNNHLFLEWDALKTITQCYVSDDKEFDTRRIMKCLILYFEVNADKLLLGYVISGIYTRLYQTWECRNYFGLVLPRDYIITVCLWIYFIQYIDGCICTRIFDENSLSCICIHIPLGIIFSHLIFSIFFESFE